MQVTVRLYAELNDYRPADQKKSVSMDFTHLAYVKTILACLKIPEHAVDLVLVNGRSVDLTEPVHDGDRVSFFPVFESFDISAIVRVRPRPLRQIRFVLDVHLGKLASHLRMLGFDTLYQADYTDDELIGISNNERRTILTRDRRLLDSDRVSRGYRVRETNPRLQLHEILRRFDLYNSVVPFQRCLRCNTLLKNVDKMEVLDQLPPRTRENFEEFEACPTCGRAYWKGSHYEKMQVFVRSVLQAGQEWHSSVSQTLL